MSRRHQQSRRRSYGRRQHELRERRERLDMLLPDDPQREVDEVESDHLARFAFMPTPMRWAEGAA